MHQSEKRWVQADGMIEMFPCQIHLEKLQKGHVSARGRTHATVLFLARTFHNAAAYFSNSWGARVGCSKLWLHSQGPLSLPSHGHHVEGKGGHRIGEQNIEMSLS